VKVRPAYWNQQSLGRQSRNQFRSTARNVTEQSLHVDLRDGEADLSLGAYTST